MTGRSKKDKEKRLLSKLRRMINPLGSLADKVLADNAKMKAKKGEAGFHIIVFQDDQLLCAWTGNVPGRKIKGLLEAAHAYTRLLPEEIAEREAMHDETASRVISPDDLKKLEKLKGSNFQADPTNPAHQALMAMKEKVT